MRQFQVAPQYFGERMVDHCLQARRPRQNVLLENHAICVYADYIEDRKACRLIHTNQHSTVRGSYLGMTNNICDNQARQIESARESCCVSSRALCLMFQNHDNPSPLRRSFSNS